MKRLKIVGSWLQFVAIALLSLSLACQSSSPSHTEVVITPRPVITSQQQPVAPLVSEKLVDVHRVNAAIRLDLRYATANNFMHRSLYKQPHCLLRAIVAEQLSQVQTDLETIGLGLKVYDCYRPLSVQKQMWQLLPDNRYVANPATGSRHNRGSAVDVTLVDRTGNELKMPTAFDAFTAQAASHYEGASPLATQNRQRLQDAMTKHGFIPLETEWWHFDAAQWKEFSLLDVPL